MQSNLASTTAWFLFVPSKTLAGLLLSPLCCNPIFHKLHLIKIFAELFFLFVVYLIHQSNVIFTKYLDWFNQPENLSTEYQIKLPLQ